ncbi:hypothetical protein HY772_02520 [Candidatus Woesearchaeota archaeon]|nr:hypothetical protein [Candidatus Woesearchaeota archaeon]
MRAVRHLKGILADDLKIKKALKQEGEDLRQLDKDILTIFDELQMTILAHAKELEEMKKLHTEEEVKRHQVKIVSLKNKLRQLKTVFETMRTAAMKLNSESITEFKAEDRLMLSLIRYFDRLTKGIDDLLEDLEKNRVGFGQGRAFQSAEDVVHALDLLLKEARSETDRAIKNKLDFISHQSDTKTA